MTFTVDEFLDEFEAPTVEVPVCPRADLLDEHRQLDRQLSEAGKRGEFGSLAGSDTRELAERVAALEGEIEQATRLFKFQALSRRRWRSLLAAHPPTKQQKAEGHDFNPETFPVAAIAACSVAPKMDPEQAERLADTVSDGEFGKLWSAVIAANMRVGDGTPKSVLATTILRMNGASLTSAAGTASPEASS